MSGPEPSRQSLTNREGKNLAPAGRHYAVPIAYTRHDGNLLVGSQFAWVRNLRTGEPVEIRLAGTRRSADV